MPTDPKKDLEDKKKQAEQQHQLDLTFNQQPNPQSTSDDQTNGDETSPAKPTPKKPPATDPEVNEFIKLLQNLAKAHGEKNQDAISQFSKQLQETGGISVNDTQLNTIFDNLEKRPAIPGLQFAVIPPFDNSDPRQKQLEKINKKNMDALSPVTKSILEQLGEKFPPEPPKESTQTSQKISDDGTTKPEEAPAKKATGPNPTALPDPKAPPRPGK